DSLAAHAGTDGSGNLTFGNAVQIDADNQSYWAGKGDGSLSAAFVDFNPPVATLPAFRNSLGLAQPGSFGYRQDATIDAANIPDAARFGGAAPGNYTLQSDGGALTLSTGAKVAGSALVLSGKTSVSILGHLMLLRSAPPARRPSGWPAAPL